MINSFIQEYRNTLTKGQCVDLIDAFNKELESGNSFIYKGEEANGGGDQRNDEALFLERSLPAINSEMIVPAVGQCWEKYSDTFKFLQKVTVVSYASKMQKTPPSGGFHTWHWEHNHQNINRNRMAVWTLYLTDHEDEGETEFLAHGLKVRPEAGKFCIFPADYTAVHRGNPVYSKDKYIVTGWYEYFTGNDG